jgi:hypothetical protein
MAVAFERIIVVVLENASRETVLQNQYMNNLRQKGVFLKNSSGCTHPSQPNYFAMTGGDLLGFNSDTSGWVTWYGHQSTNPTGTITSIVDLLEAKNISWKAYAEDLLSTDVAQYDPYDPTNIPSDHGNFARRHVPFLSYPSIVGTTLTHEGSGSRAANIVNAQDNFEADVAVGTLPKFSFYTPNLINDGHSLPNGDPADAVVDQQQLINIANFLQGFLSDDPISKFPPETLIVITFDEAYPVNVPYNIYTLLIGDMLQAGTTRMEPYNHYSLLRSIEDNFALGTLGRNDDAATPYWFLQV